MPELANWDTGREREGKYFCARSELQYEVPLASGRQALGFSLQLARIDHSNLGEKLIALGLPLRTFRVSYSGRYMRISFLKPLHSQGPGPQHWVVGSSAAPFLAFPLKIHRLPERRELPDCKETVPRQLGIEWRDDGSLSLKKLQCGLPAPEQQAKVGVKEDPSYSVEMTN